MKQAIAIACLTVVLLSCAKQAPPPGGPEDKTPPEIVASIPKNGSTDVSLKPEIVLSFSERMNREKIGEAVFVSPPPDGGIRLDWSGDNLEIKIVDSLVDDRTYIVTVGSSATDAHNNRLMRSFMLAFSTGATIDSGSVSGMVVRDGNAFPGATVAAYPLTSTSCDNFIFDSLQYVTQAGSDGSYEFEFMSAGDYAIFAFDDRNGDKAWNPGREGFSFPGGPAILVGSTGTVTEMNFAIFPRDTSRLGLADASFLRYDLLQINLTAPVLGKDVIEAQAIVHSHDNTDTVYAAGVYTWLDTTESCVAVFEDDFTADEYFVRVTNLVDIWGNEIETEPDSILLQAPLATDGNPPSLADVYPSQAARNVARDSRIRLRFDERVRHTDTVSGAVVIDEDSNVTALEYEQIDPFTIDFFGADSLRSGARLTFHFGLATISDLAGNSVADSTYSLTFRTLNEDSLGSFSGKVVPGERSAGRIPLVFYSPLDGGVRRLLDVESDGSFRQSVIPGDYVFLGFLDRDPDGYLGSGEFDPFNYAEPVFYFSDTVSVRPRFETEGVRLEVDR